MKRPVIFLFAFILTMVLTHRSGWGAGANIQHVNQPTLAYLVLEEEPTVTTTKRWQSHPDRPAARAAVNARRAEIQARQAALKQQLAARNIKVTGEFHRLANVLRIEVPPARLKELEDLPGVVRIKPVGEYWPLTASSVPFIGAPSVWGQNFSTNADGTGIRLGIIDTGIDYFHADFGGAGQVEQFATNNPAVLEPGTFPTTKVAGGYDFAGEDYTGPGIVPEPDPDPLDASGNGHGTHVAGIAAGLGVLTNGLAYSGSYTQDLATAQFFIGPGVAPRASLYALKVFGRQGSTALVLDALEWAADPNHDGDFKDRLDVVNLSLGAAFGLTGAGDVEQDAINRLADLGCIVVAGSGNNGNVLYNTFSPAIAEKCISVGGSIDAGYNPAIEVLSPLPIAGLYEAIEGLITRRLSLAGPIQGRVVYVQPNLACATLSNGPDLAGNIALIDRGTCTFVDKIRRAQSSGARAVIMVNNVPGSPVAMGGTALDIQIPGFMISQADGDLLKSQLASNLTVRLDPNLVYPRTLADQLYGSSSRGPASPHNLLKPEIVAPGQDIFSAAVGTGSNGISFSGTSMATPHVAGAAALLRQLQPAWSVEDIKAALLNTARPTCDGNLVLYPESWTGAGGVQLEPAGRILVTAKADNADGLVALSFGSLVLTNHYTETRFVVLTNHGSVPVTLSIMVSNTVSENGFLLRPLVSSVTVPAFGSARVPVQLTAEPHLFDRTGDLVSPPLINGHPRNNLFEASGRIWFQSANLSIHLPYYCILRAASALRAQATLLAVPAGNNLVLLNIPQVGESAHNAPLVSVFQLGLTSSNEAYADPARALGDLLAIGAASDAPSQADFTNSTIYFGIAVAGDWTTPQSFLVRFDVLIDLNGDGADDYRVFNSSEGNFGVNGGNLFVPNSANDAFLSVVENKTTGTFLTNGYLNVFPATRDTAPFNNSVVVLPVAAHSLGLTPSDASFRYRVRTIGPFQRDGLVLETTPYVTFDAAHPAVDTTVYGISRTPFHPDANPVRVRVDRAAASQLAATTATPPGVLLMHHFNLPAQRVDVVSLELDEIRITSVTQNEGLVRLRFTSGTGKRYRLERAESLSASTWTTALDNIIGTGGIVEVTDQPAPASQTRFYRLQLLP